MAHEIRPTALGEELVRMMQAGISSGEGGDIPVISHRIPVQLAASGPPTVFTVLLSPDEDGGFLATCGDVPDLIVYGADEAEALELAEMTIVEALGDEQSPSGSGD